MVPLNAASILNPNPSLPPPTFDERENLGGSTRPNTGVPVFRRFKIPTRFRVGLLPAGADSVTPFPFPVPILFDVSILGVEVRAFGERIFRVWSGVDEDREVKFGDGGARVRKKFVGLV